MVHLTCLSSLYNLGTDPAVLLLLNDVTAVAEKCLLRHRLATGCVFCDAVWHVPLLRVSATVITWHLPNNCLATGTFAEQFLNNSCLLASQSWLLADIPHILQDASVFQHLYLVIPYASDISNFENCFKKFLRTTKVLLSDVSWVTLDQMPWDLKNLLLGYQNDCRDYTNYCSNWPFFWFLLHECQTRHILIDT
jgi:hypothetical protein